MNCTDMMQIAELEDVLKLKAGKKGSGIWCAGFILRTACSVLKVNIRLRIISMAENL